MAALWPTAGLFVWAAHFGAIYAVHAVACERALAGGRFWGAGFVQAGVAGLTVLGLLALGALAWPALRRLGAAAGVDGGEDEGEFRDWLTAASCAAAALGVVFQALPGLALPVCWG